MNARKYSKAMPIELIFEILLRLPARSIARCRCVSKLWDSMLRRPDFTELFLTRSHARPQLLFVIRKHGDILFFSSPQPNSSPLTVSYLMKFAFDGPCYVSSPINGFVCIEHVSLSFSKPRNPPLICNPSTGQSFTLPNMMTTEMRLLTSFLGYDPIEKQYKVLAIIHTNQGSEEHRVLTLGTRESSWRMIQCDRSHEHVCGGICINGVLYYKAVVNKPSEKSIIVCFDLRTEKFAYVNVMKAFIGVVGFGATLIDYNGKLGALLVEGGYSISRTSRNFEIYVLENPDKHEWSKHVYEFPPLWENVVGDALLQFVGLTGTNEVLLSRDFPYDPLYVFYYSLERKTVRVVEIQGVGEWKNRCSPFVNHVENLKLMQTF